MAQEKQEAQTGPSAVCFCRLTSGPSQRYAGLVTWRASVETVDNPLLTGVAEPVSAVRAAEEVGTAEGDWLCAWCLNRVANERDRFEFGGRDEFTFSNPDGICFEIITFSVTLGCEQAGVPTLDHTWFAGHAWSYCRCERCGQHLGWYYAGAHDFAGLIKSRIVRALTIRN